jgi:predicted ATPase
MSRPATSALRFTSVHLKNWRNFLRAEVELGRRAFIVGPNASGKSNFLDALRFLHEVASTGGGLQEAVRRRGGVRRLRCLAARQQPEIGLFVRIGSDREPALWEYELQFNQEDTPRPVVTLERAARAGETIVSRPDQQDAGDSERRETTSLEPGASNKTLRELEDFLRSVRFLNAVPELIREPARCSQTEGGAFGGDLLERIASAPEQTRRARLRLVLEALRNVVPQIEQLEVRRDSRGRPHLRARYEHWRAHGAWQTEEEFSDGTLRLTALLWEALDGAGPLLLEEPELSLHPAAVTLAASALGRLQRRAGRQAILTTHSPELLAGDMALEEIVLLVPGNEGTNVVPAVSSQDAPARLREGAGPAVAPLPDELEQLGLFEERRAE